MTLQFNEGAYANAYNQGQQNEEANKSRLLQLLNSIGQTGNQVLGLNQQMQQMKVAREENKTLGERYPQIFNSSNQLSAPVSPVPPAMQAPAGPQPQSPREFNSSQLPGGPQVDASAGLSDYMSNMPSNQTVAPAQPANHIEGFQNFLKGQPQVSQQQPDSIGALDRLLADPGKFRLKDYAQLSDVRKNLSANQPKVGKQSIDQLLAEKVSSGELTIEDALKMKQQQMNIISYDPTNHTATTVATAPKGSQVIQPKPTGTNVDKYTQAQIAKARTELAENRPLVTNALGEIERVEKLNDNSRGGLLGAGIQSLQSATNMGTDSPEFKNTVDVINTMQQSVARVLKSTFGGQLSDAEREYLNQVYGALPKMSPQERKIAMTNVKTMLRNKLSASESKLQELSSYAGIDSPTEVSPESGQIGRFKFTVKP